MRKTPLTEEQVQQIERRLRHRGSAIQSQRHTEPRRQDDPGQDGGISSTVSQMREQVEELKRQLAKLEAEISASSGEPQP